MNHWIFQPRRGVVASATTAFTFLSLLFCGCATEQKKDNDFFTSGSREADQRAEQRVAKDQQLRGEGGKSADQKPDAKKSLYERLGGQEGLTKITDDFITRALADPRVNWERKDVTKG